MGATPQSDIRQPAPTVSLAGQARLISLREIPLCRYAYHSGATLTQGGLCGWIVQIEW